MVDPVFVDTSEGRAVVADSLKLPPVNKVDKEIDTEKLPTLDNQESNATTDLNNSKHISKIELKKGIYKSYAMLLKYLTNTNKNF